MNEHETTLTFTTGTGEFTEQLPNGDTLDLKHINYYNRNNSSYSSHQLFTFKEETAGPDHDSQVNTSRYPVEVLPSGYDAFSYLDPDSWKGVWDTIETAFNNVRDGLLLWVDEIYGKVQAGELNTEDLLTPRELANMSAEEEGVNQAISDLQALNIAIDLEREAEIRIQDIDATLYGTLGVTSEPSGGVNAGDVIDPSNTSEDYYLTYDISKGSGNWSGYDSGVDGGTVTFTEEPFQKTLYRIKTAAGETAEVTADDFSAVDGAQEWTADISGEVETAITEIDSVKFYATTEQTEWATIQLDSTFEVVTFRNSEGEEVESATFDQSEPQDDTNYITEAEWKAMQERNQELIEKYEEAAKGGGGNPVDNFLKDNVPLLFGLDAVQSAGVIGGTFIAGVSILKAAVSR